jgi:uncharacterized protein YjbI with pentapeptide repeats
MANQAHLDILDKGSKAWNAWRKKNPDIEPDLSECDRSFKNFAHYDLRKVNFFNSYLEKTKFVGADLWEASFPGCKLNYADMRGTHLGYGNFYQAELRGVKLTDVYAPAVNFLEAKMADIDIRHGDFREGDFRQTDLTNANLSDSLFLSADFDGANLTGADFRNTVLQHASFVDATVEGAQFSNARIYGISVWNLKGEPKTQEDLIISPGEEGLVTTDDLEVAQFVYLMYDNKKIRNVLNTITGKGVLILGRFTPPERKAVLDGLREKLRQYDLLPIVFDFDRPTDKDYTETVQTLAGMSRFVIADVTNPKSTPLELEAVVKQFKIPYVPIIDSSVDPRPFAMIVDLQKNFHWVLPTVAYKSQKQLMNNIEVAIIDRAIAKHNELQEQKAREVTLLSIDDLLNGKKKKAVKRAKR